MRKCYLDHLPHHRGNDIDWNNSIGMDFNFVYDDIKGTIYIVDYCDKRLIFQYNGQEYNYHISNIHACKFAAMLDIYSTKYKYHVGDIINKNIKIINPCRKNKKYGDKIIKIKAYECVCLLCGSNLNITEENLKQGVGCSVCAGKKVVKGINDIATTNPIVASWMLHEEDRYQYTQMSNRTVNWMCPMCSTVFTQPIAKVSERGLACPQCNNNVSFSERAFYALCVQLKELGLIDGFVRQYSPKWSDNKRYDFKINGAKESIVETHGVIHYEETKIGDKKLEDIQANDRYKEILAKQNINYPYIIINVCKSTINWFKRNIMNSILPIYYGFSEDMIDWQKIQNKSISNIMLDVCELWNNGLTVGDISNIVGVNRHTVLLYLKTGVKCGKCDYTIEESECRRWTDTYIFENACQKAAI